MTQPAPRIIRLPEVRRISGLSTTSIYRLMSQDKFPRQRLISVGAVGWLAAEVFEWVSARPKVQT